MYFVYFLKSEKDNGLYIGRTNDIERRFAEHSAGSVPSTKGRRPLILLRYDRCQSEVESVALEKEYKKGYKREGLRKSFELE